MQAFAICTVTSSDDGSKINSIRSLSEGEFAELKASVEAVNAAIHHTPADLLQASFGIFSDSMAFHRHITGSQNSQRAAAHAASGILAMIFGWLSMTRLFLDHTDADLVEAFGKDSEQRQLFKRATNWAYDHSSGYRIVSQLRNAFQHAGVPPFSLTMSLNGGQEPVMALVADRAQLLSYYDWKARVRDDISAMPDQIDVYNVLAAAVVQFEFVASQVREIARQHAVPHAQRLDGILKGLPSADDPLFLTSIRNAGSGTATFQTTPFDADRVASVLAMPARPGVDQVEELACVEAASEGCASPASALLCAPTNEGVVFVPACDDHQRAIGKLVVERLGASMVGHPCVLGYMVSGLNAAGHGTRVITATADIEALERMVGALPDLGLGLTASGWQVQQHPQVLLRTQRAAAAMQAWQVEGGGTPAFFAAVNAIIAEDGDAEPLMTGLINMSNLMLTLVSVLQGRPRESVLGSLVEEVTDASLVESNEGASRNSD